MFFSMWLPSTVLLLVVGVRTGPIQERDIQPRRCYFCSSSNGTAACQPASVPAWSVVVCPTLKPYCATFATAPNIKYKLTCAAATNSACSLKSSNRSLQFSCVCAGHLCNAPFTTELINELNNFHSLNVSNDSSELASTFIRSTKFANISDDYLYNMLTIRAFPAKNSAYSTTGTPFGSEKLNSSIEKYLSVREGPRAESLKNQGTAPSDDDEDESEGSGSFEEAHAQRRPPPAVAAPGSYLPASGNKATTLSIILSLITIPLFMYVIV